MDLNPGLLSISSIKIPVPWGHIAAKTWGNPSTGKPILGVHGWMDNAGTFDTLIPFLSKSFYVVAIDLPGHGLSSHLPMGIPYHYIDLVASIRRVVIYLKWKQFFWMGHSVGGILGVIYATLFPNEIHRLILLDLIFPITNSTSECASSLIFGITAFLIHNKAQTNENETPVCYSHEILLKRLMLVMEYNKNHLPESAAKILLIRATHQISENEWTFSRDLRMNSHNTILLFTHEQIFDMLKQLKCHILMVKAKQAPWFHPVGIYEKALKTYKLICPSFKFIEVDGNHFVHLIHPTRVSKHIVNFFK